MKLSLAAVLSMALFASCGSGSQEETTETETTTESVTPEEVTLTISGDDQMQFSTNELHVKAGQKVTLILTHTGTMDKQSMGHNWVLLIPYVDVNDFAQKAQQAGLENDYIPQSELEKIIAHTDLLGGGESDTITFTAPDAGEYDYICSFPGHHGTMKGKLIVE